MISLRRDADKMRIRAPLKMRVVKKEVEERKSAKE